jgi:hypothetical protein
MKTILLILLVALNVNAQKKKTEEYFNTGPSFSSLQRMYAGYVQDKFKKPQQLKHLGFNFYAYNELQKVTEPKEKARLYAYLEINYFRGLCLDSHKAKKPDANCDTYAIKVSDYSKYSPKYNEDKRSKVNPKVEFDFENDTYKIKKETFSVKTGGHVKSTPKKTNVDTSAPVNSSN